MRHQVRNATLAPALALLLVMVGGCGPPRAYPEWRQDAYVWSFSSPPREVPVPASIQAIRILVAQWSRAGKVQFDPQRTRGWAEALAGRRIVFVVRIEDDALEFVEARALAADLHQQLRAWPTPQGPEAIEIDHDRTTRTLPAYTAWLSALRNELDPQYPLWITALPDWRRSSHLEALLGAVDAYTLQVHAVDQPDRGLFDPTQAAAWASEFAARSDTPHYIALPTYQLRVGWNGHGRVRFVGGEAQMGASAAKERQLFSDPAVLRDFALRMQAKRPHHRLGIAWFRLPLGTDRQGLSPATFAALVDGLPLEHTLGFELRPVAPDSATYDLVMRNHGRHDAALPMHLHTPSTCSVGDVTLGYAADRATNRLVRVGEGLLRSGEERVLGWATCRGFAGAEARVERQMVEGLR